MSVSVFVSLVGNTVGIANSAVGKKICMKNAITKTYKWIIKKKKKKHDKIVLLAKTKLNAVEVSFSKVLIGSFISQDEFFQ